MKLLSREFVSSARALVERVEDRIIEKLPVKWLSLPVKQVLVSQKLVTFSMGSLTAADRHDEMSRQFFDTFGCELPYASGIRNTRQHLLNSVTALQESLNDFTQERHRRFMWVLRGAPGISSDISTAAQRTLKYKDKLEDMIEVDFEQLNIIAGLAEAANPDQVSSVPDWKQTRKKLDLRKIGHSENAAGP